MYYILFSILLVIADQITKALTCMLKQYDSICVIEGILNFTRHHNTGGPWSIFDEHSYIFIIFTIVIFVVEAIYFKKRPLKTKLSKISASLINAGAAGNLIDRIFRGYVVDMIELKFIDYPVFNFADCCIVTGCILMCICVLFDKDDKVKKKVRFKNARKYNSDM